MNTLKYKLLIVSATSLVTSISVTFLVYFFLPYYYDLIISHFDDSNATGEVTFLSTIYILAASLATVLYSKILKVEGNKLRLSVVTLLILITNFTIILNSKGKMTIAIILFYIFLLSPFYLPLIYKKNNS